MIHSDLSTFTPSSWSGNTNGFTGSFNSFNYATFNSWKQIMNTDSNSIFFLPNLDAGNYLQPVLTDSTSWILQGHGAHLNDPLLNEDINGVARPASSLAGVPDIGAYELLLRHCLRWQLLFRR